MTDPAPALPEHYFRHESGRLVSVLSRRFGVHRVELCEDAVQTALLRAVQSWSQRGLPDDKSAWLYRVALNEVLGALRRDRRMDATDAWTPTSTAPSKWPLTPARKTRFI